MGRKKAYIREQVVDSALEVFAIKGYAASSLSDLTTATGLNKKSLYNEFDNKAGLFDAALGRYIEFIREFHVYLQQQPLQLDNIRDFFDALAEKTHANVNGCLLTLSLNEAHLIEAKSLGQITEAYQQLEVLLYKNLWAEQIKHGLSRQRCRILAKYFLSSVQGLTNLVRLQPTAKDYRAVVNTIVSLLPS